MFNWLRSRRPSRAVSPRTQVRLGVELSLENRAVPSMGCMMDGADGAATVAALAATDAQTASPPPAQVAVPNPTQAPTPLAAQNGTPTIASDAPAVPLPLIAGIAGANTGSVANAIPAENLHSQVPQAL